MYKKGLTGWFKHWDFTILDILLLQGSFVFAYFLRHGVWNPYVEPPYRQLAMLIIFIHLILIFFSEGYSGIIRRTFGSEGRRSLMHASGILIGILLYEVAFKLTEYYSRVTIFIFWIISFFALWFGRTLLKRYVRQHLLTMKNRPVMVVVTQEPFVEDILSHMETDMYHEFRIDGLVIMDKDRTGDEILGIPVIASEETFYDYVKMHVVDEVFISLDSFKRGETFAKTLLEMGVTVHLDILRRGGQLSDRLVERCGGYLVLTSSMNIASPPKLFIKRVADILGGIVGLLFTGIFFIIFAPIIKLQSPGPVFYSQRRVGQNGRRFTIYKFRTMVPDADSIKADLADVNEMEGPMFKMKHDPRIIPVGRFMRRFSIDEFPQFWNVLKGEMSLVGTRPPTVEEVRKYAIHHKARLGFKPGLTGLWQVSGRNDITDFEKVVELDTKYIMEWSLGLDFQILLKTVEVVLKGQGE